jgi:Zn-dependent protease
VYIYGPHIDRRQNGIISYAGPLTNIIIAALFFALGIMFAKMEVVAMVARFGMGVNLFLALFNLLPVPPLDGSKVFAWNKALWAITFVPLAVLVAKFWFGM